MKNNIGPHIKKYLNEKGITRFNLTIVELKLLSQRAGVRSKISFNLTIVELKPWALVPALPACPSFNLTIVELKLVIISLLFLD